MARKDGNHQALLLTDSPGDAEQVRAILAQWGVEESSIRRLLREHRPEAAGERAAADEPREPRPRRSHADA